MQRIPASEEGGALFPLLLIIVFVAAAFLGYLYNPLNPGPEKKAAAASSSGAVSTQDALSGAAGARSLETTDEDYRADSGATTPVRQSPLPVPPASPSALPDVLIPTPPPPPPPDQAGTGADRDVRTNNGQEGKRGGASFSAERVKTYAELNAESGMYVKEGGHFNVKFDGGENAIAGHLISLVLEEAYIKIGSDLDFYPDDKIEAVLYTREQFRDVTRSPSWDGAIYDGRIKIPAGGVTDKTELLEKVLFHEYTHAVVHRLAKGRVPTWLNEGIAQYEEGKDVSYYRDALRELAAGKKLSLKHFEGSFMRLDRKGAELAYVVSLSATGYIIREFGIFSVRRILEGLGNGLTLDNAIRSAVYLSYEDLERSWLEHLSRS